MHKKARVFLAGCLVAGAASIGRLSAQIPTDVAGELDRLLAQVAVPPLIATP
jgi:hypothetical protein